MSKELLIDKLHEAQTNADFWREEARRYASEATYWREEALKNLRLREVNGDLLKALEGLMPYAQLVIHSTDDAHDRDVLETSRAAIARAKAEQKQ